MPSEIAVEIGSLVVWQGDKFIIDLVTEDYHVLARQVDGGAQARMPVSELEALENAEPDASDHLVTTDQDDWSEARRRKGFVDKILERRLSRAELDDLILASGEPKTTLYRWSRLYRASRRLSSLLPYRPNGGLGTTRLAPESEKLLKEVIERFYLSKQQPTIEATVEEVRTTFRFASMKPPARGTIRRRIKQISERTALLARSNAKRARAKLDPHPGQYTDAKTPLSIVQIDHTKLDIMVVDEEERLEVGRPFITLAIDVHTRMIVGYHLSLDPVGALATGQCIATMILPKDKLLQGLGIKQSWPCWGIPAKLHLDNAKEFRGTMLQRACDEYSINIDHRPLLKPEYGGHIERLMGTIANEMRKLPGATFSNIRQRAEYDSAKHASLTLDALEKNLVNWITGVYHQRIHSALGKSPQMMWQEGIFGNRKVPGVGLQPIIKDELKVHLDFLPVNDLTVQTYGLQWDNVRYYHDVLRPYIGSKIKFAVKRDPRNISKVYFVDPKTKRYEEIPYRDSRMPVMSVWELRSINERLRKSGREHVNEDAIRQAYDQNRERVEQEKSETKRVRRERARKATRKSLPANPQSLVPLPEASTAVSELLPFEIESL